jgi:hypothetical protein
MWRFLFLVRNGWFTKESGRFPDRRLTMLIKALASNDAPPHVLAFQIPARENGKRQSRTLCLYSVKKLSPGLSSQSLIHLENVAPANLSQLSGMDGYITHNHRPFPPRNDGQAHVAWCVAWGRYGHYLISQGLLPRYQIKDAQLLQRAQGRLPELDRELFLELEVSERIPVRLVNDVSGSGERHPGTTLTQVPADVVWM